MGMLNSFNQLLITKAFWSNCINFFVDFLGNYGWAIILFTIVLKLILTPFDILQRKAMKKQTKMQARLQPEITKLQEKYGNDRATLNQKINELYQKNNVSMKGVCLPMLISLVVTLVVFISLFNALNTISSSKDSEIFNAINTKYEEKYEEVYAESYISELQSSGKTEEEIRQIQESSLKDVVLKEYDNQKDKHGFLWVQNLWRSDTTTSPIVGYNTYKNYYSKNVGEIVDETAFESQFNTIKSYIESENRDGNGLYILIVLAGVVTLVVQWLSQRSMRKSNNAPGQTNKVMMIVMPLVMLIFASTSNALFTLYIITNSVISAVISKIIDSCMKDKDNNVIGPKPVIKSNNVVEYSRNYKGN